MFYSKVVACKRHSKTNFFKRRPSCTRFNSQNSLCFIGFLSLYHHFQFGATEILGYNALLYFKQRSWDCHYKTKSGRRLTILHKFHTSQLSICFKIYLSSFIGFNLWPHSFLVIMLYYSQCQSIL
jgi:hypothetical protein